MIAWSVAAVAAGVVVWYITKERFEFAQPKFLWAALLLVPVIALYWWREQRRGSSSRLSVLARHVPDRIRVRAILRPLPFAAAITGCCLLLIALARPQSHDSEENIHREGIDIMVALDISASMLAKDLRPDRLEASKRVAMDFIDGRPNDRIGLVVYEGEAFTQCPLTTDHRVLKELFSNARSGLIERGTAVGMGLATALNRLRESTAKSKVVILLTDGVNNTGAVQPIDAGIIAEKLGIRVYTIGVGTRGKALSPVALYPNGQYKFDYVDVDLDEATLQKIATTTGGQYFRATDEVKLRDIYKEIDRMEKTRFEVQQFSFKVEEFHDLLMWGSILLLAGFVLDRTLLRGMA
ncbi:MAG: VWA domain-containing protein [Flavobacteriales bacterium]|nr:VWA domain-containing protein [Flavobacteriales bacterium]